MFDVSWSELLILAVVTLIFVGPKELPVFLGTLGRYAGMVRKQATEFRRHFDDAMREAELDQIRNDVETMARDVNESVMSATRAAEADVNSAKASLNGALPESTILPSTADAAPPAVAAPEGEAAALAPPSPAPSPARAASGNV